MCALGVGCSWINGNKYNWKSEKNLLFVLFIHSFMRRSFNFYRQIGTSRFRIRMYTYDMLRVCVWSFERRINHICASDIFVQTKHFYFFVCNSNENREWARWFSSLFPLTARRIRHNCQFMDSTWNPFRSGSDASYILDRAHIDMTYEIEKSHRTDWLYDV